MYDFIVFDLFIFFNFKVMYDIFDIQCDYFEFINGCLKCFLLEGLLYFFINFCKFKLELEKLYVSCIKDIIGVIIFKDFCNFKIYYCWLLQYQDVVCLKWFNR